MHTCTRRVTSAGLTVTELVVATLVLGFLVVLYVALLPHSGGRKEARRIRCRNNLNQLGKGMATYLSEHGDNRFPTCPLGRGRNPGTYNGAEWLASLYWTGVIPDPGVFICPSSPDTNEEGVDLGTHMAAATFGSQTVSYAGLHYNSVLCEPDAVGDDYPPNMPMASDDTQGDINHGDLENGGMSVLFSDCHVEFRTNTELDLRRAVGDTREDALLRELRN